jgi:hypothetical protein
MEHADMPGMNPKRLAGLKLIGDHLARKFCPRPPLAADALKDEAFTSEDPRAERLLVAGRDLDARAAGEEPAAVHHVLAAGLDIHGDDASWRLRCERDGSRCPLRGVGAHEQRRAARRPFERSHEPAAAATHAGGHLDGIGHPRELACLGGNALARFEVDRQDRHGGSVDLLAHGAPVG